MSQRNKIIKPSAQSEALKEMRIKANLSVRKLADEMEISFSRVHQLESGRDKVTEEYIERFLAATGFSTEDWLLQTRGEDSSRDLRIKCHEALDQVSANKLRKIYDLLTSV